MDSDDERNLRIEIPSSYATSSDGMNFDDLTGLNGWRQAPSSPNVLYWEGTIDLSGYVRDQKTFFPELGFIQEGPYWNAFGGSGQTVITVISSVPLDVDVLILQVAGNGGPGFIDLNLSPTGQGQQDWNTVLFCETQLNLINSNLPQLGICQPITNKQTGSLAPTASETLFVMKFVAPTVVASLIGDDLFIPASRVILAGRFGTEPDVEYMMRLKRSVELANQV